MIRYLVILVLIGYSVSVRLELFHRNNSFGQLYETCDKTHNMIASLNYKYVSRQNLLGKIKYCKQNKSIILSNYRNCIANLGKVLK